jgi:hypothetical protein
MKNDVDVEVRYKKERVAEKYHEFARELRGRYLNSAAVLDTQLAEILTEYFCKDDYRRDLFFSEIATGQQLGFRVKIELLTKILKIDCKGYLNIHPELLKTLNRIKDYRNKLAHATIDVSDEALSKDKISGVGLVTYRKGKKVIDFITFEEAEERQVEINMMFSNITDIKRLLSLGI